MFGSEADYLLSLFLGALSLLLLDPELIPVVVPDFILLVFILPDFILEWVVGPGPTLPSLDAPEVGCVCAEAIAVTPSIEATTRAEMASLDRMRNLLWMDDAGVRTSNADLGSGRLPVSGGLGHALTELAGWESR
jgi:hypothetical protein